MFHHLTRIAGLVLAFGFFISCSSLKSSNQENQPSANLSEQQIQQRIDSLDEQINGNPNEPELYYQKGSLLTKLAQKQDDPDQRTDIYVDAQQALTEASDLYQDPVGSDTEKIKELLNVTWSNEHNQGVEILQSDTANKTPNYTRAANHFNNATIIIPDSAISYQMGARAYYNDQQPEKAIEKLETARDRIEDVPVPLLEQLAFLYLENDQPQQAVKIYEQAESFSDQNLNLLHGLANAYINNGQHQQAADLLERLIENDPQNVIYGQSLATELYFIAAEKFDEIVSELQQEESIENTSFSEADSLLNRAEDQFAQTLDRNSRDQELKFNFAQFYQNSASKYQQLLSFVDQERKEQLTEKVDKYVSNSIPLLEELAEETPENKQVWQNLYQAYSYLGMNEKANNAKSNF